MEYPSKVSQPLNKQDQKVILEFIQRNVLHRERERSLEAQGNFLFSITTICCFFFKLFSIFNLKAPSSPSQPFAAFSSSLTCPLFIKEKCVGNLNKIPSYEKQNKQRKHTPNKTITRTKQYLRGSAICLCLRSCRDFTIK